MSNATHTPGPWRVWPDEWSDSLGTRSGDFGVGSTGEDATRLATVHETDDETEANARLIAAAPDLLAALSDLLGYATEETPDAPDCSGWLRAIDDARSAIARARGV